MLKGNIFDIQRGSFVDGPGIRTIVFFKGCNLRCFWCHNPESWIARTQLLYYESKCIHCLKCVSACPENAISVHNGTLLTDPDLCTLCGICEAVCPKDARMLCGKEMDTAEVMSEIVKDKLFYTNSGGGVTFSGGECLLQIDFLEALLTACHDQNIQTAVDTAGNVDFDVIERIIPRTDIFLYDLKCVTESLHHKGTGVTNTRILANLEKLLQRCPDRVWIIIPVIPGFNANEDEFHHIADFLDAHPHPASIRLLPYHRMGESKRKALGLDQNSRYKIDPPNENEMRRYHEILHLA